MIPYFSMSFINKSQYIITATKTKKEETNKKRNKDVDIKRRFPAVVKALCPSGFVNCV